MRFHWLFIAILLTATTAISLAAPATAPTTGPTTSPSLNDPNATAHRVDHAIANAETFLLSHQDNNGAWNDYAGSDLDVGQTSLAGLALLSCGVSHESPQLQKAIAYLKHAKIGEPHATYSIALRAAFYSQLPPTLCERELKLDVAWLQADMIRKGAATGLYTYNRQMDLIGGDFSNSQYGVLGVWYAQMSGLEVSNSYWKLIETAWQKGQNNDGGFGYTPGDRPSYASMTAAGAATLFVTNDYLHAAQEQNLAQHHSNAPLEKTIQWLGDHFAADRNPGKDAEPTESGDPLLGAFSNTGVGTWVHYMLYGYERVGEASGLTHFGSHNWFDEGAKYLIRTQHDDGSWEGTAGRTVDTAYALLFLSRGRSPVAMQKLQFNGRWNNRSRDCAMITRWLSQQTERHLNWQIVPDDATPAEFRQSRILYTASDQPLLLGEPQRERIQAFIDQGGCLLGVNEGDAGNFARSIVQLGHELYPKYEFRDLPDDHLIYKENFPIKDLPSKPQGLSNGVRELIVTLPTGDMSWKFQQGAGTAKPEMAPAFAFVANLYAYLNDKTNPPSKGDDYWIVPDASVNTLRQLRIARLKIAANCDPEPAGWMRLTSSLHNTDRLQLQIAMIDPVGLTNTFPIAHLTATDSFAFTSTQADALKHYIDAGGLLLFDAAGGSEMAQIAFENLMQKMYPDAKLNPLPPDDPIYTGKGFGGADLHQVIYRQFTAARIGRTNAPRLRAMQINGRIAMIDSAEDLSAGLVGYNIDGITGYSPASATAIMRNILLSRISPSPGTPGEGRGEGSPR